MPTTQHLSELLGQAQRLDIDRLVLDKLPTVLDQQQKQNKIKNLLQKLKNQGFIYTEGKVWKMSKPS